MQKETRKIWHFNQPPQEIWEYLTKPDLLEQWFAKTNFQPIVGHKFQVNGKTNCIIECEVLEIKPFAHLSYSWKKNSAHDDIPFTSKVLWTLTPKNNGTELELVHDGFVTLVDYTEHNAGWIKLVDQMTQLLNHN